MEKAVKSEDESADKAPQTQSSAVRNPNPVQQNQNSSNAESSAAAPVANQNPAPAQNQNSSNAESSVAGKSAAQSTQAAPAAQNPHDTVSSSASQSTKKFDLVVVGGGTAGIDIAFAATKQNVKTALIEPNLMGGVCLNTGCIPTKTLLRSAELYNEIRDSGKFGLKISGVSANFAKIMSRAKGIVDSSRKSVETAMNNPNLVIFRDHASFVGEKKIKVGAEVVEGGKVIIATGSKPHVPPIPGLNDVGYLVSGTQNNSPEDILNIQKLPKTLIVIGGGYIGFEFATFFYEMGSKVIILEALDKVLGNLDSEVLEILLKRYDPARFSIFTNAKISRISKAGKGNLKQVYFTGKDGKEVFVSGDALLVATGRVPASSSLELEKTGVNKDGHGAIVVDEFLETSCKGIYAVGDVTGKVLFAHTAKKEGIIAMGNALGLNKAPVSKPKFRFGRKAKAKPKDGKPFNMNAVPWAVFVNPPVAGVGTTGNTESANLGVMKASFARAARSSIIGDTQGILKVWFDKSTRKILRAEMIGLAADDLIGEFTALINCGATTDQLKDIIHIHPTLSEVVDSLKEDKPAVAEKPADAKDKS